MQVLHNPAVADARQTEHIREQQDYRKPEGAQSFKQVLDNAVSSTPVSFSKHATLRLAARNINLSETQISRVEGGMQQAREKGIRSSLVMVDGVALVVNIPNKTVVTAISGNTQNIFTNIDGAVIV